jgi:hypothetical protein
VLGVVLIGDDKELIVLPVEGHWLVALGEGILQLGSEGIRDLGPRRTLIGTPLFEQFPRHFTTAN